MAIPKWIYNAIFYQIFPDRFNNADQTIDPPNVKHWGSIPTSDGYQGGDLQGISEKLDYLVDLGINAIYLNPIFLSTSTHRYNTTDYYKIDPILGDWTNFIGLLKKAHSRHIKVILDGVFNHCGRGFFAFTDLLENQEHSPYKDWFYVHKYPVNAYSHGEAVDYAGWWKHKSLPKLNTFNPRVKNYIFDIAKYWIDAGIDGWRLDVPNEINDDEFWAAFRSVVKNANPEAYLLGEIWTVDSRWVNETHFDGLMNYPFRAAIVELLTGKISGSGFSDQILKTILAYPSDFIYAMYNLLGSHDTERILTILGNDVAKLKIAYLLLFTLPGVPAIYYGDEIGITGGKDPDCRKAFQWDESKWNKEIRDWCKKLIAVKKESEVLQKGDFFPLIFNHSSIIGYGRRLADKCKLVVVNLSEKNEMVDLELNKNHLTEHSNYFDLLLNKKIERNEKSIQIALQPSSGTIIKG